MAEPMSDEDLYHLTGSWEAAAALRDQQRQAPVVEAAKPTTLSDTPTLAELKAMYNQMGATQARENYTEQGTTVDYIPVQYGGGWSAWENDNRKIIGYEGQGMDAQPIYDDAPKTLGGFSKQEGDYINTYDLSGKLIDRHKWNENMLKTTIKDLGPMALMALTAGGGAGLTSLGELFGLTGTTAATAGGALAGGVNAWGNDQDILKGALLGGVSGAGSVKLNDILGADTLGGKFTDATVGDVKKAIDLAQNPSLTGAANLVSKYGPSNFNIGDTGLTANDIIKGAGNVQALKSGDYSQIFKAITGMAGDQGKSIKSSLAGFEANPDDFIEGYFQPGGEGYNALMAGDTTVLEDPQNLDAFLRSISPYAMDDGTSVFKQPEDIPEMETVAKRPKSLIDVLGSPDILQTVQSDMGEQPEMVITDKKDEPYVPSIRTKDIVSDIPDTPVTIDTLFPDIKVDDILQTVTPTKTVTPPTKVTTPPTKTTTPTTTTTPKTTEDLMASLGLGRPAPSQDPYANIKSMEELFGGDIGYKLRSLGVNPNQQLASADMDALLKLLRG